MADKKPVGRPSVVPEYAVKPQKGTTRYFVSPRNGHRDVYRVTFDGTAWKHVLVLDQALPIDARAYAERWNRLAEQEELEGPK